MNRGRRLARSLVGASLTKKELEDLKALRAEFTKKVIEEYTKDLERMASAKEGKEAPPPPEERIKDGDKVRIDVDGLMNKLGPIIYKTMRKDFREFVEGSRDKVYTAKHVKEKAKTLITFEEDSRFYFVAEDIILVE